jgi:hypothetical protein
MDAGRGGTSQLKEPHHAAQAGRLHRLHRVPHERPLTEAQEVLKASFPPRRGQDSRCFTIRQQVSARHGYNTNRHNPVMTAHLAGRQLRRNSAYGVSPARQAA